MPDPETSATDADPLTFPEGRAARLARRWRAPRATRLLLALVTSVVLGLVVALVVVVRADARPLARAGDEVEAGYDDQPSDTAEVVLPWVRVEAAVGPFREQLPDPADGLAANLRAPEGGGFVLVHVEQADGVAVAPRAAVGPTYDATLATSLRVGGRAYPVEALSLDPDDAYARGGTYWVAVDDRSQDVALELTVDGVTQVVDPSGEVDAGRAAGLADLPDVAAAATRPELRCRGGLRRDDGRIRSDYRPSVPCRVVSVLRTAHVDGLGWAEDGRQFLVVQVVAESSVFSPVTGRGSTLEYWDLGRPRLTALLDGARPVSQVDVGETPAGGGLFSSDDPQQYVFDVAADEAVGDLDVRLELPVVLDPPFVVDRDQVVVTWTVPGEELS